MLSTQQNMLLIMTTIGFSLLVNIIIKVFFILSINKTSKQIPKQYKKFSDWLVWLIIIPFFGSILSLITLYFNLPNAIKRYFPNNKHITSICNSLRRWSLIFALMPVLGFLFLFIIIIVKIINIPIFIYTTIILYTIISFVISFTFIISFCLCWSKVIAVRIMMAMAQEIQDKPELLNQ